MNSAKSNIDPITYDDCINVPSEADINKKLVWCDKLHKENDVNFKKSTKYLYSINENSKINSYCNVILAKDVNNNNAKNFTIIKVKYIDKVCEKNNNYYEYATVKKDTIFYKIPIDFDLYVNLSDKPEDDMYSLIISILEETMYFLNENFVDKKDNDRKLSVNDIIKNLCNQSFQSSDTLYKIS